MPEERGSGIGGRSLSASTAPHLLAGCPVEVSNATPACPLPVLGFPEEWLWFCPGLTAAARLRSCASLGLWPNLWPGIDSCLFRPVSHKMA